MSVARSAFACLGSAGLLLAATLVGLTPASRPAVAAVPGAAGAIASALPGQNGFGTIKGKLVWGGPQAPVLPPLVAKGDPNVKDAAVCAVNGIADTSLAVDPATKGIKYGIAYLVRPKGANPEAAKAILATPKVEMDQKGCEFLPRNVAVHKDQTVVFKSSDPVGHNVRYSGFSNTAANLMLPPNGVTEKKLVAERLPLVVLCDIHPWMKGHVAVFDHPFFAVTAEDGSFEIKGVPAGDQNLVVWQERVGYATGGGTRGQVVKVPAGGVVDVGTVLLDPAKVKK
jgi:plastocyanin